MNIITFMDELPGGENKYDFLKKSFRIVLSRQNTVYQYKNYWKQQKIRILEGVLVITEKGKIFIVLFL